MTKTTIFRLLIVLDIFCIPVLIAMVFLDDRLLPPELAEWIYQDAETPLEAGGIIQLVMGLVALIFIIPSYIGLLMLKKWGAWLYLCACFFWTASSVFAPTVMSGLFYSVDSATDILAGIILGMAFFSDVLDSPRISP